MSQCLEKYQVDIRRMIATITSRLYLIEQQMIDTVKRTTALCCMTQELEKIFGDFLHPRCHEEANSLQVLYRGLMAETLDIVCRNPKCKDIFKGYKVKQVTNVGGVISLFLKIVFGLT